MRVVVGESHVPGASAVVLTLYGHSYVLDFFLNSIHFYSNFINFFIKLYNIIDALRLPGTTK